MRGQLLKIKNFFKKCLYDQKASQIQQGKKVPILGIKEVTSPIYTLKR